MAEGELILSRVIDKCTIASFQYTMRDFRDRYPSGRRSCEGKQLQFIEMPSTTDSALWYVHEPFADWKRERWAYVEVRKETEDQTRIEIWDSFRVSEGYRAVGHVSLNELAALIISEATDSMLPENRRERREIIRKLYARGLNDKEIKRFLTVSAEMVKKEREDMGLVGKGRQQRS